MLPITACIQLNSLKSITWITIQPVMMAPCASTIRPLFFHFLSSAVRVTMIPIPMVLNSTMPGIRKLWKGECCRTVDTDIPKSFPVGSTIIENPAARAFKLVMINKMIPMVLRVLLDFMMQISKNI